MSNIRIHFKFACLLTCPRSSRRRSTAPRYNMDPKRLFNVCYLMRPEITPETFAVVVSEGDADAKGLNHPGVKKVSPRSHCPPKASLLRNVLLGQIYRFGPNASTVLRLKKALRGKIPGGKKDLDRIIAHQISDTCPEVFEQRWHLAHYSGLEMKRSRCDFELLAFRAISRCLTK